MASVDDFIKEWNSDCDYITAHTSGSTGKPKEIHLSKDDMRASAHATNSYFNITEKSVLACPLSIDYIAGKMMVVRALEADCQLLPLPVSNTLDIKSDIDLLAIVPSQVESLLDTPGLTKKIRNVIIGGAPLSDDMSRRLYQSGVNAYATYGMTETCSHVALARINPEERLFKAMPGISFECDGRGCLIINAPSFSFKKLITNDIVELIDENSFKWIGRYDNVINSGGIKISPEVLENEIRRWFSGAFYVTGVADVKWGEVPVIVFEGKKDEETELIELLRSKINHKHCPAQAFAVERIPRTTNGKIIRKKP